tara:strand:- start:567 stop:1394 length:828 start_codon:yes stop_codon:yes gene_type:complete
MFKKNTFQYSTNYIKIIEVKITHSFFVNQPFSQFKIFPKTITKQLFKDYGIIFKSSNDGFVLIIDKDEKYSGSSFKGEIKLLFDLEFTDQNFLQYTNIPNTNNQLLYFENSFSEKLHKSKFVDKNVVRKSDEGKLLSEIVLSINKKNEYFGYGNKKNKLQEKIYEIAFDSRDVIFRYNFSTKKSMKNFYVTDEEDLIKLKNFVKRKLFSGKDVFSLVFKNKIKARDNYNLQFFLKRKEKGVIANTFVLPLPNPDKKNIFFDNTDLYYADIFVKID